MQRNLFFYESTCKKVLTYFSIDSVAQELLYDAYFVVRLQLHASRIWHSGDSRQVHATTATPTRESVGLFKPYMRSGYKMKHLLYVMLEMNAFYSQTLCICYSLFSVISYFRSR